MKQYYSNRQGEEGHARPSAQFTRSRSVALSVVEGSKGSGRRSAQ
jgi:hypothetical protein